MLLLTYFSPLDLIYLQQPLLTGRALAFKYPTNVVYCLLTQTVHSPMTIIYVFFLQNEVDKQTG